MLKKYHVSKNLVPPISSANGWVIGYRNSNNGDYIAGNVNYEWLSPFFDLNVFGRSFTISADKSKAADSMTVYYYNGNTFIAAQSSTNYNGSTFNNIPNGTTRLCFAIRATAKNEAEQIASGWRVWINAGSTALPYEPYSSEVWHPIPYRKYATETDTLTSLPEDIIADGNNAEVLIKGNMQQTGTPSPSSIIMPEETGERSSNLVEGYISGCNINASGALISNAEFNMFIAKVEQGKTYCLDTTITVAGYFTTMPTVGSVSYDAQRSSLSLSPFTAPIDGYLAYRKASSEKKAMMNEGNELLPYEPYGYRITVVTGDD